MRMVSVHKNSVSFAPKKLCFFNRSLFRGRKMKYYICKMHILNNKYYVNMCIFAVAPYTGSVD